MAGARVALVATALSLALTGCAGADDQPGVADATASPDPSQSQSSQSPSPQSPSSQSPSSQSPSSDPTHSLPTGGTSSAPVVLEATTDLFEWTSTEAATTDTVTKAGDFTITVDQARTEVRVDGPGADYRLQASRRFPYNDVISDGTRLVAVAQDVREMRPSQATVLELSSGDRTVLDSDSDVPTLSGGAWAIGAGVVHHATYDKAGRYCLASVDLGSMTSSVGYCAPRRSGFSNVVVSPTATSLLTFGGRPQCRTVARLDGSRAVAFDGVAKCQGWDGAATPTGAIWSVVTNPSRVEVGHFYASVDGGFFDLGVGSTGTLTWCGDSAYFVRDAQKDVDKARLLRWTPDARLEVVYESPGAGAAFLSEPRCAGDSLTVSALGEGGDEQVWAKVP